MKLMPPAAFLRMISKATAGVGTSLFERKERMPFAARKTRADARAARLLPSRNGWFMAMWKRCAAAIAAGDLAKVDWARIPWQAWGAIGYAGLVAIFLCFIIWYESVKEVGSAKTGVYSNLTPILAIFFVPVFFQLINRSLQHHE